VEADRKAERGVARPPGRETLRKLGLQSVYAPTHPQPDNVAREWVDFGVAHDAVGKLGIATVPGVKLGQASAQPLLWVSDRSQGVLIRKRIALHCQPRARKEQLTIGLKMSINRVPLHTCALCDGADARARRSQRGMQVNGRLDDAPARFRLILGAAIQRIRAFPIHCTVLYSHIDGRQDFNYTGLCNGIQSQMAKALEVAMKASSVSFPAAVLAVIVGMIWGIVMAISRDHSAMPAHAHLNLLGWVSLFLFGIFYHLHPAIDRSRAALVQVTAWIIGTVVLTIGVGLIHTGHDVGEPFAIAGSLTVLAAMLLFGWLVLRREHTARAYRSSAVPAE
jgi:hypothetical protein